MPKEKVEDVTMVSLIATGVIVLAITLLIGLVKIILAHPSVLIGLFVASVVWFVIFFAIRWRNNNVEG